MNLTLVLTADDKSGAALTPDTVSHCANRLSKELGYGGAFMCLPGLEKESVILTVLSDESSNNADAERLIRHVACWLSADVTNLAGNHILANSTDNDTSFLEQVPAPEDEVGGIWLHFSITEISAKSPSMALKLFLSRRQIEYENEPDGVAVYLAQNGVLDLFFDDNVEYIDGEMDATYAGAGMFAEACELAEQLASALGGKLVFSSDDRATYAHDRDFDKLRGLFLESFRQQLTWAVIDDRDGYQAYIGWGTDTYEPEEIPGSIITFLGRYNIDELVDEIGRWGLEAIVDRRFVMRGTRYRGPDDNVKNALTLLWCTVQYNDHELVNAVDQPALTAVANLELALECDSHIELPIGDYLTICRLLGHSPKNISEARELDSHYPAGYLKDRVAYGFGSYLRKFKLPGMYGYTEQIPGERVVFSYNSDVHFRLECDIDYSDQNALPRDGFFRPDENPVSIDIGGSATCDYSEPEPHSSDRRTIYIAKAEILIRDERYNFVMSTDSELELEDFRDTIYCCRSIEDLDELPMFDSSEKPRAVGGCFFRRSDASGSPDGKPRKSETESDKLNQCYRKISFEGNSELTLLSSKLGGVPYCPAGIILPSNPLYNRGDSQYEFLAQLNFAEASWPQGFPSTGILQIYVNLRYSRSEPTGILDQKFIRTVYFDSPIITDTVCEQGIAMRFSLEQPKPIYKDFRVEESICRPLEQMLGKLNEFDKEMLCQSSNEGGSRVGGSPMMFAPDPRELAHGYDTLLFQLDTRDLIHVAGSTELPWLNDFCRGDGRRGILNLFINQNDLRRCDFSNILAVWTTDSSEGGNSPESK
ncbi:MAG TPA: DUF1963 domain-containing protein [Firmicutes bacterium]|nr:DUF1963 domain-containing protein [Bacillota bacterium]